METTNATPKDDAVRQVQGKKYLSKSVIKEIESSTILFPIEIFPQSVQEYFNQAYDIFAFSRSYSAVAFLSAVSGAMGGKVMGRYKSNWLVSGNIWVLLIGPPSKKKTHPVNYVFKPLKDIQASFIKDREDILNRTDEDESKDKKPPEKRIYIKDITIEKLGIILKDNPHGVVSLQDEMTSFFSKLTRYENNNRPDYLELWSRGYIDTLRVNRESVVIHRPYTTIIGNIQPEPFVKYFKESESDGFMERFLITLPEYNRFDPTKNEDIDPDVYKEMNRIIEKIYLDRPGFDIFYEFSRDFKRQYNDWKNKELKYIFDNLPTRKESIAQKLSEYVLRFSLILHMIKLYSGDGKKEYIDVSDLKDALKLYDYFKQTAFYSFDSVSGEDPLRFITDPRVRKALAELPPKFNTGDAKKVFEKHQISNPTMYKHLKNTDFFCKTKHGEYERLF